MKRFDSHPEEALELEKHGLLGNAEQAALRAHLRECGACRAELWAHGHTPFRVERRAASDAELDRAAVAAALDVLNERAARKARWRRSWPVALGLALPLVAFAAAGFWRLHRAPTNPTRVFVSAPVPFPVPVPVPLPVPVPVPVPELPPSLSSSSLPPLSSAAAEPVSAAELFRRASDLRRAGQGARAVGVYRELQGRYASSPEAKLSYVIAGGMLLDQGKASVAITQFDRYLATSGPASEEALLGRAQALQRLGRVREEALAWQQLLARFPASVHAQAARARLAQLGASAASEHK